MAQKEQATIEQMLKEGIHLSITDPEMIAEFKRIPAAQIVEYAGRALKIGVLSLRSARGEVDATAIKEQLDATLNQLELKLLNHTKTLEGQLSQGYNALVLRDEITTENVQTKTRELLASAQTTLLSGIDQHIRTAAEPLAQLLNPNSRNGTVAVLGDTVQKALKEMSDRIKNEVLTQFSRDSSGSAMQRLEALIQTSHGAIVRQFSLDDSTSALSRLHESIGQRMEHLAAYQTTFQAEVRSTLAALTARKEAEAVSTTHGMVYEEALGLVLGEVVSRHGHTLEATGNTTGSIRSCKIGDYVARLNNDSIAPGALIVVEAKSAQGYDLAKILAESEIARKNRGAQISIFVIDPPYAPGNMGVLSRQGDAIVVKWKAGEDSSILFAAFSIACALVVKTAQAAKTAEVDAAGMERAVNEITRRVEQMAEVSTWTVSIQSSAAKILDRMRISTEAITTQAVWLMDQIKSLKGGVE